MLGAMLVFRLFHVICSVLWVGGMVLFAMFILPAVRASGPGGGQVMRNLLVNSRFTSYFPAIGGLTVLSGLAMMWRDSEVSQSNWGASGPGITFSIGGLAGIIALIVGGVMIGRSANQLRQIVLESDPGAPPSPEQAARMAQLQARADKGTRIVLPLLFIALITMSIARYV